MREIKKGDKYLCKTDRYEICYFIKGHIYTIELSGEKGVSFITSSGVGCFISYDELKTNFTDLQEESKSEIETPKHYQTNSIDVIDFCKLYNLNFNLGNIVKYACRIGKKENDIEDLKKVIDYAQREIKHLQTLNNKQNEKI